MEKRMENWNRKSGSCGQFVLFARASAHRSINSTKVPSAIVEYGFDCVSFAQYTYSASTPNAKTIRTMPIERCQSNDEISTMEIKLF